MRSDMKEMSAGSHWASVMRLLEADMAFGRPHQRRRQSGVPRRSGAAGGRGRYFVVTRRMHGHPDRVA